MESFNKIIIIDTGTWIKFDKLLKSKSINKNFIKRLYTIGKVTITPEIEEELLYFNIASWNKNKTHILPILEQTKYLRAINDGFDKADASIFGIIHSVDYIVISEDQPLVDYGKLYKYDFIPFIEFLVSLLEADMITKNQLYKLNKKLYELRNISKIKSKRIAKFAANY